MDSKLTDGYKNLNNKEKKINQVKGALGDRKPLETTRGHIE
jgi:hypothetical protein